MRFMLHLREIEPVIAVRPHDLRIAMVHFAEELEWPRTEASDVRAERRVHVRLDG